MAIITSDNKQSGTDNILNQVHAIFENDKDALISILVDGPKIRILWDDSILINNNKGSIRSSLASIGLN